VNVTNIQKRPFLETMTVQGRAYHYFRATLAGSNGKQTVKRTRLPGEPGSPEFEARYEALALEHVGPKSERVSKRVKPKELPSRASLHRLFRYDPETGGLFWHNDGQPADVVSNGGRYKSVGFMGERWMSHRVIWKMLTGQEPDEIDHINGDGLDNRFANLRSVTPVENMRNRSLDPPKHGKHGVTPFRGKWRVNAGGYLGLYATYEDAVAAREEAERALGFHENHGRQRA
jgi:hypothetical protein